MVIIKFTQKKNLKGLTKMEAKEELIRNVSTEYKNLYKNWMTKTPENLVASASDINFLQEWH